MSTYTRLFVVLKTSEPGDDPQSLIISAITLDPRSTIKDYDGKALFNTNISLRRNPHCWYPPKMRLTLTSDDVMVDPQSSTQEIDRRDYLTGRSEIQFRLAKLPDIPMESKKIVLTVQLGNREMSWPIYLHWNKDTKEATAPVVQYNFQT